MTDTAELEKLFPHRERVKKPQTNADKIRSMSDEELVEWIWTDACPGFPTTSFGSCPEGQEKSCIECWLEWLEQEAKDEQS